MAWWKSGLTGQWNIYQKAQWHNCHMSQWQQRRQGTNRIRVAEKAANPHWDAGFKSDQGQTQARCGCSGSHLIQPRPWVCLPSGKTHAEKNALMTVRGLVPDRGLLIVLGMCVCEGRGQRLGIGMLGRLIVTLPLSTETKTSLPSCFHCSFQIKLDIP